MYVSSCASQKEINLRLGLRVIKKCTSWLESGNGAEITVNNHGINLCHIWGMTMYRLGALPCAHNTLHAKKTYDVANKNHKKVAT